MHDERRDEAGDLLSLETDPTTDEDRAMAEEAGLALVREVLQLRVPLPLPAGTGAGIPGDPLPTRSFLPGVDDDEVLRINNRAFAWHPDQSDWTAEHLRVRCAEPWFDAEGFLLLEDDGRLVGFCWTKIHPATPHEPPLGEIFVIAVDPDRHGRGWGRALVRAGLDHLATSGLRVGMLHVEADNTAALRLYEDLGFTLHSSHCWWRRTDQDR